MSSTSLKTLFRRNIKVVPGGPADTSQGTRGANLLVCFDALIDELGELLPATPRRWAAGISDWAEGELFIYLLGGSDAFATVKPAGAGIAIPQPTGVEDDYSRPAAKPLPVSTPAQVIDLATAQVLLQQEAAQPGRQYAVLADWNGNGAGQTVVLTGLFVPEGSGGTLDLANGRYLDHDSSPVRVTVDLAAGTYTLNPSAADVAAQVQAEAQARAAADTNLQNTKAPLNNPSFTGPGVTAPTPPANSNNTVVATTAWVVAQATAIANALIANLVGNAPAALDTVYELAAQVGNNTSSLSSLFTILAGKVNIASNLADLQSASAARGNLGLGNVNNTSDANKPVSTATQAALNDLKTKSTITNITANYTLSAADFGTIIRVSSSSAVTVTVPAGLAVGTGGGIEVRQVGSGVVTLAFASGVTNNATGTKTQGPQTSVFLLDVAANIWDLSNAA